jgi:hypothetical protein
MPPFVLLVVVKDQPLALAPRSLFVGAADNMIEFLIVKKNERACKPECIFDWHTGDDLRVASVGVASYASGAASYPYSKPLTPAISAEIELRTTSSKESIHCCRRMLATGCLLWFVISPVS